MWRVVRDSLFCPSKHPFNCLSSCCSLLFLFSVLKHFDVNFNRFSPVSKLPNRHGFLLTLGLRFLSFFKNILVENFGKVVDRDLKNPNTSLESYIRIYALIVMCRVWGQTTLVRNDLRRDDVCRGYYCIAF